MVIVFAEPLDDRLVAHRVVEQLPGSAPSFVTKGDRNLSTDPYPVRAEDVRGRVRWSIPAAGRLVTAAQTWWGAVLLVGVPGGALVAMEAHRFYRRRVREQVRQSQA